MYHYKITARISTKNDDDPYGLLKKLHEMLSTFRYDFFTLKPLDHDNDRIKLDSNEGSHARVIVAKDKGYVLHVYMNTDDEKARAELNTLANRINDFLLVIPTLMIDEVDLEGEFAVPEYSIPLVKIIDPKPLMNVAEKVGLKLTPRGMSFSSQFKDWDVFFMTFDKHYREEEKADISDYDTLFLHMDMDDEREGRDMINKIYQTAIEIEALLKQAKEAIVSGSR
jgi:hypothetical protein